MSLQHRFFQFFFSISLFGLSLSFSHAQSELTNPLDRIPLPVAPEAASLGELQDIPISGFSGTADLSVALYNLQYRDINVPLSAVYHSSGVRVSEEAGWLGMNWSVINAGGSISRTIRGQDDFGNYSHARCKVYEGYYEARNQLPDAPGPLPWLYYDFEHTLAIEECNGQCTVIENGMEQTWDASEFCPKDGLDGESDLYNFQLPNGYSGKFFLTKDGQFVTAKAQNIQISATVPANDPLGVSWLIETPDGNKFYFGTSRAGRQNTYTDDITYTSIDGGLYELQQPCTSVEDVYTSTWFLERAETHNGYVVDFNCRYETGQRTTSIPAYSENYEDLIDADYELFMDGNCTEAGPDVPRNTYSRTVSFTSYDRIYLDNITWEYGKIEFHTSDREDLEGGEKLEDILIYHKKNGTNTLFKRWHFDYDYFSSTYGSANNRWEPLFVGNTNIQIDANYNNKRLKLLSIQDMGNIASGTTSDIPPWTFGYNESVNLPPKTSFSTDHWGYAVGSGLEASANTQLSPTFIRVFEKNGQDVYRHFGGADREPNEVFTKAWLLTEFRSPLGGSSVLEYEANRFVNTTAFPYEFQGFGQQNYIGNPSNNCERPVPAPSSAFTVNHFVPNMDVPIQIAFSYSMVDCPANYCPSGHTYEFYCLDENQTGESFTIILENTAQPGVVVEQWSSGEATLKPGSGSPLWEFELNEDIVLPVGTYRLFLQSNSTVYPNHLPSNLGYYALQMKWAQFETASEKTGGGVRISKVTDYSITGVQSNVRTYHYENENGGTSGKAFSLPIYTQRKEIIKLGSVDCNSDGQTAATQARYFIRKSASVRALSSSYLGSFTGYSRVEEWSGENAENGKTVSEFFNQSNSRDLLLEYEPFGLPHFTHLKDGSLLQQTVYTASGLKVVETENQYNDFDWNSLLRHWNFKVEFRLGVYEGNEAIIYNDNDICDHIPPLLIAYADVRQWHYVEQSIERQYDMLGLNPVVKTTAYTYDPNNFNLKTTTITNSDGTSYVTQLDYAADEVGYDCMVTKKMTAIPIRARRYVGSIAPANLTGGFRLDYADDVNAGCQPIRYTELLHDGTEVIRGEILEYTFDAYPKRTQTMAFPEKNYTWQDGLISQQTYDTWQWTYSHNDVRLVESITDKDGQISTFAYDPHQRTQSITSREGAVVTTFGYNYLQSEGGQNSVTTTTTYTDGTPTQTSQLTLDGRGRPRITSLNGVLKNEVRYDELARIAAQTHLPGNLKTFAYDGSPLRRVIEEIYPASSVGNGNTMTTNYGTEGNYYKTTVTDENGNTTSTLTDILGRQYQVQNALGDATTWQYDHRNNVTKVIPPKGDTPNLSFFFDYDNRNRRISETIPGAAPKTCTYYDDRDLLATKTDGNGNTLTYAYDGFGRETLLQLTDGSGTKDLRLTRYDNDGISPPNPRNIGQVNQTQVRILDGSNTFLTTDFEYDTYGRLLSSTATNHIGGQDITTTTYNDADWLTLNHRNHTSNAQYGSENISIQQQYEYDIFGRQTKNTYTLNNETPRVLCTQLWNDRDQLVNKTLGGGLQSLDYLYNERGWMRQINQPLDMFQTPPTVPNSCSPNELESNTDMMENTFCGTLPLTMEELLTYRFEENLSLECYNPCENSYLVVGTPADCPVELVNSNPVAEQLYVQTVQIPCHDGSFRNETRPDLSSFPSNTTLYRIRFCNGDERYVFQEELNNINPDTYVILQEIEINSNRQMFNIREDCGNIKLVGLDALVVLVANEANFTANYFVEADICDPLAPNCTEYEQEQQLQSLEAIQAQERNLEEMNFPTYLIRVKLCDGSEVYLFMDELAQLSGTYIELQLIFIENAEQILVAGSTITSADIEDLFALSLHYDEPNSNLGITESNAQKNGNISWMTWQMKNKSTQAYAFTYDDLNRLKSATHAEIYHSGGYYFNNNYNVNIDEYDANGNIVRLRRNGPSMPNFECGVPIDNLTMTHNGNQLLTVTDDIANATDRARGFNAPTNTSPSNFLYDFNGNQTFDPHKELTTSYNYLNLPEFFDFGNGDAIDILYDSEGQKLRKEVNGTMSLTKDYCQGIEYSDNSLEAIYNEEGRVIRVGNAWEFQYVIRDYLGSTRVLFKETVDGLEILDESSFYPFGAQMELEEDYMVNPSLDYLYTGKEMNREYGLELVDYGARWRNPWSPQGWTSIDAFAEKYYAISPYSYVANNPLIYTDPTGDTIRFEGSDEFILQAQHDLAHIKSDEKGAELVSYLESHEKTIKISEAYSIIGMIKNLFSEGSGDLNHLLSSVTDYEVFPMSENGLGIRVEYSQIEGIEFDGIDSASDEVLHHELVHASDFLDGTVSKVYDELSQGGLARGRLEGRAMQQTNDYRARKKENRPMRTLYAGKQVLDKNNKILKGVKIGY